MASTFADRLNEAMDLRGVGIPELAEMTGIKPRRLAYWVSGEHEPRRGAPERARIAKALGYQIGWLNGRDVPRDREAADSDGRSGSQDK